MPIEIEFVGGPADGHRMTRNCAPEDLPADYHMSSNAGWAAAGPTADVLRGGRTARYVRDTADVGPVWHYRYDGRP